MKLKDTPPFPKPGGGSRCPEGRGSGPPAPIPTPMTSVNLTLTEEQAYTLWEALETYNRLMMPKAGRAER